MHAHAGRRLDLQREPGDEAGGIVGAIAQGHEFAQDGVGIGPDARRDLRDGMRLLVAEQGDEGEEAAEDGQGVAHGCPASA